MASTSIGAMMLKLRQASPTSTHLTKMSRWVIWYRFNILLSHYIRVQHSQSTRKQVDGKANLRYSYYISCNHFGGSPLLKAGDPPEHPTRTLWHFSWCSGHHKLPCSAMNHWLVKELLQLAFPYILHADDEQAAHLVIHSTEDINFPFLLVEVMACLEW